MASNIFYSRPFQAIVKSDVEHNDFVTDDNEKRLVQLAQKVIGQLCSSELHEREDEQLSQFIEKIEQIDKQFSEKGRKTVLSTCAYTLNILKGLRTGLSPSHQDIAKSDFVLLLAVLRDLDILEDPLTTMVQWSDFLENQLLPALKNVQNLQELRALEPLVLECSSLSKRLMTDPSLKDAAKNIENLQQELQDLWNVKHLQMQPAYQRLLNYKKGDIGDLSDPRIREQRKKRIQELVDAFKESFDHPALTREEKIAIFRAIQTIKAEFGEQGIEVKFAITKAFHSFLMNDLLPAIKEAKSLDDLTALNSILQKCAELAEKYNHQKIDEALEAVLRASIEKAASFKPVEKPAPVKTPAIPLPTTQNDRAVIQKLSREIIGLNPTIGDANVYKFSAAHGKYISEAKTKSGVNSMLAAGLRAVSSKRRYSESPEEILRLGQDLLKDKSGVCDHMAAAVIAKIVEHIRSGGKWDADVELMGNGAHAFIAINRPRGETNDLDHWRGATIVDTWLGAIGVHPNYQKEIPSPQNGVISDQAQVNMFVIFFGALEGSMEVQRRFSAEELRAFARKR